MRAALGLARVAACAVVILVSISGVARAQVQENPCEIVWRAPAWSTLPSGFGGTIGVPGLVGTGEVLQEIVADHNLKGARSFEQLFEKLRPYIPDDAEASVRADLLAALQPHADNRRYSLGLSYARFTFDRYDGDDLDEDFTTSLWAVSFELQPARKRRSLLGISVPYVEMRSELDSPTRREQGIGDVLLYGGVCVAGDCNAKSGDVARWFMDLDLSTSLPTGDDSDLLGLGEPTVYGGTAWSWARGESRPIGNEWEARVAVGYLHNFANEDLSYAALRFGAAHSWERAQVQADVESLFETAGEIEGLDRDPARRWDGVVGLRVGPLGRAEASPNCFLRIGARVALDGDALRDDLTPFGSFECNWGRKLHGLPTFVAR